MFLGYNTNGFAHHRLTDVLDFLGSRSDYAGVALTPDVHHLDPYAATIDADLAATRQDIDGHGLHVVIETGARFLLDTVRKHQPTLISPDPFDRRQRREFLLRCLNIAARLDSPVVSFWSGTPTDDAPPHELMQRLAVECRELAMWAAVKDVRLAFEPEPGMFIDTMPKFAELHARVNHPAFGLTLDVGHLVCMGETPASDHIRRWKDWLWNVHLDDMRPGVHDHLMFGEGEVDFADVFGALREIGYAGMASVELSRHSHDAANTARQSFVFLSRFV